MKNRKADPTKLNGTWKRKNWTKKKKKTNQTELRERGWFWSLDENQVLYLDLFTPTLLPIIPRPGPQALVVSGADKIVISA